MSNKIAFVCSSIWFSLLLTPISAQEKCKVSEGVEAANSTYTQQHVLDVGDVPGHQIRIYEVHRTYPNDKPNCEGLKRVESWDRGSSDYIDRNGHTWGYGMTVLENGDKMFNTFDGTSQTVVAADGSKKSTFTGVSRFTGGTGKYNGIRGMLRVSTAFDPDKNINKVQAEGEYWLGK